VNIRGQYYVGGVWHYYDVASAFDHDNRRVFKSFYDETTAKTADWFFYYDADSRLTEIRYTPDISVSGTYSTFQLFWLGGKLVFYLQTDQPTGAVSKRYVAADETDRPMQLWNWPSSGDATRVWAINPSAWGADTRIVGASVFQPVLFAGQYSDVETAALENDGVTVHRPALALNGHRSYDPLTGGYIQVDPLVDSTWSTYTYANGDPVGDGDVDGRGTSDCAGCWGSETINVYGTVPCLVDDPTCWGGPGWSDPSPPPDQPNTGECMVKQGGTVCTGTGGVGGGSGSGSGDPPDPYQKCYEQDIGKACRDCCTDTLEDQIKQKCDNKYGRPSLRHTLCVQMLAGESTICLSKCKPDPRILTTITISPAGAQ
jgi:RHS repeat-associated protein